MSVLPRESIEKLAKTKNLIVPLENEGLQPASYDLALGKDVLLGPLEKEVSGKVIDLIKEPAKKVKIKPGQFVAVLTKEYINLPADVCARFGIKSEFSRKGLIAFGGLQADPGWSGHLAISLVNVGPEEIELELGKRMFSIEFHRLEKPTMRTYTGEYQDQRYFPPEQLNYILGARTHSLAEIPQLRERIDKLEAVIAKKEIEMKFPIGLFIFGFFIITGVALYPLGLWATVASFGVAISGLLGGLASYISKR